MPIDKTEDGRKKSCFFLGFLPAFRGPLGDSTLLTGVESCQLPKGKALPCAPTLYES